MINHTSKNVNAEAVAAVEAYLAKGGKVTQGEGPKLRKADKWALQLNMLHGSKGHVYVK